MKVSSGPPAGQNIESLRPVKISSRPAPLKIWSRPAPPRLNFKSPRPGRISSRPYYTGDTTRRFRVKNVPRIPPILRRFE